MRRQLHGAPSSSRGSQAWASRAFGPKSTLSVGGTNWQITWAGTKTKGHKGGGSFAFSNYMVLEPVKPWVLIWTSISIHLYRIAIGALHGQSAVLCLSSKCGRIFPQNGLAVCTVRAFQLLLQSLFFSFDFCGRIHIQRILKQCTWGFYTIPNGCAKQQHLSTSPSNHTIASSSSPHCFPWFGQHFPPYDLSCKGFCMNFLSLCSDLLIHNSLASTHKSAPSKTSIFLDLPCPP